MDEQILIKSESYDIRKVTRIVLVVCAVLSPLVLFFAALNNAWSEDSYKTYWDCQSYGHEIATVYGDPHWDCQGHADNESEFVYAIKELDIYCFAYGLLSLLPVAGIALASFLINRKLKSCEMTVTNKRIIGTVAWGKRVDLPLDSVSATATSQRSKSICVSTPSGEIRFLMIKNAERIYQILNEYILKRQDSSLIGSNSSDAAEQLKKYKELLDMNAITQEEYEIKKKQLLDL